MITNAFSIAPIEKAAIEAERFLAAAQLQIKIASPKTGVYCFKDDIYLSL